MEESIDKNHCENLTESIWGNLPVGEINPRQLSPLVLAYIGDCVYDLVRGRTYRRGAFLLQEGT